MWSDKVVQLSQEHYPHCWQMQKAQPEGWKKTSHFQQPTKTIETEHSYAFHVEDHTNRPHNNPTGLLVDTGVTYHIVTTNIINMQSQWNFKTNITLHEVAGWNQDYECGSQTRRRRGGTARCEWEVCKNWAERSIVHTHKVSSQWKLTHQMEQNLISVTPIKKLVHNDGTKFANEKHGQLFDSQTLW